MVKEPFLQSPKGHIFIVQSEFLASVKHTEMHTQTHLENKEDTCHFFFTVSQQNPVTSCEPCLSLFLIGGWGGCWGGSEVKNLMIDTKR